MITVLPSKGKSQTDNFFEKIYKKNGVGQDSTLFTVRENDEILGYAYVDIFDIYARVLSIEIVNYDKKDLTLDYIVRTVMSYALNRDTFTVMSIDKKTFGDLKTFFFYEKDNKMYLEIYKHMGCKQ